MNIEEKIEKLTKAIIELTNKLDQFSKIQTTNTYIRDRLILLTKWNQYHSWPSTNGLRHLVFHEKNNGFHTVIRRVGRVVLINEKEFFIWADKNLSNVIMLAKGK